MPAAGSFRTVKMGKRGFLFLRSHRRGLAGIKADENHFVIVPRIERKHPERTYNALLDLVAEHRTGVIDKSQDYRLLAVIFAEANFPPALIAEFKVRGDLGV